MQAWDGQGLGVGVRGRWFPAVDVDVRDQPAVDAIVQVLRAMYGQVPRRIGNAPKLAMPFAAAGPGDVSYRSISFTLPNDQPGDRPHQIELLGEGKQWCADHVHPDRKVPYQWPDGRPTAGKLPVLDDDDAIALLAAIQAHLERHHGAVMAGGQSSAAPATSGRTGQPAEDLLTAIRILDKVPNDGTRGPVTRGEWVKVAHAFYGACGKDAGDTLAESMFTAWSEQYPGSAPGVATRLWTSIAGSSTGVHELIDKVVLYAPEQYLPPVNDVGGPPVNGNASATPKLRWSDPTVLAGQAPPPPQPWAWEEIFPAGELSVLTGAPGQGKSYLAMEVAAHLAAGQGFNGKGVDRGGVLALFAEEGYRNNDRRARNVERLLNLPMTSWGGFRWLSADDVDSPELFVADRHDNIKPTQLWHDLEAEVAASQPRVVVLDNANALLLAEQNSMEVVAAFLSKLQRLCKSYGCAVVLLHHPNKSQESAVGGSNAYFSKPRSVAHLRELTKDENPSGKPTNRVKLQVIKSNVGRVGVTLDFMKDAGTGVLLPIVQPAAKAPIQADYDRRMAVLAGLDELAAQGRYASPSKHGSYPAGTVLPETTAVQLEGLTPEQVKGTLADLLREGHVVIGETTTAQRNKREAYQRTGTQPKAPSADATV